LTITEVSKKYGISAHTLRYYERIGLIPKAKKMKMELGIIQKKTADGLNLYYVCERLGLKLRHYLSM